MIIFRIEYLIFSEGRNIGSGMHTTESTDPNNNGWNTLKNAVIAQLKKKHPDKSFSLTQHSSRKITKEEAEKLTNGWMTELDQ